MAPLVLNRFYPWEQLCTSRLAQTDINNNSLSVSGASLRAFTGESLFVSVLTLNQPILNEIRRGFSGCSISLRSQDKEELQRLPWVLSLKTGPWSAALVSPHTKGMNLPNFLKFSQPCPFPKSLSREAGHPDGQPRGVSKN